MTQPALAEQPLELPASAEIYRLPPKVELPNPILEAEPETYQPPPNAVLNRPEPKKRQRKAKGTGKRPGRPKNPVPQAEAPVQPAPTPQTVVAAPPRHPFFAKPVSTTTGWAIFACMFALAVGAALGFWAIR